MNDAIRYTYDELGRRVRETGRDLSVEYQWDESGWLTEVATVANGDIESIKLRTNALGEVAEVDGQALQWDSAAPMPRLVSFGSVDVAHGPAGVVGVGDAWIAPGWRTRRITDSDDPWKVLRSVSGTHGASETNASGTAAAIGVTASGGFAIGSLELMGARAYDPSTRGFLSTDPLDPVTGSGWAGNPYAYAGNDPLHQIDPTGLRPVTDGELARYAEQTQGWFKDAGQNISDWWDENWEYVVGSTLTVVGAVLVIGGIVASFTGVGAPAGIAISAAGGFLFDFGLNINEQKSQTNGVDWGKAAGDAVVSGIIGGLIGGAVGKLLSVGWKLLRPLFSRFKTPTGTPNLGTKPSKPEVPKPKVDPNDVTFAPQQI